MIMSDVAAYSVFVCALFPLHWKQRTHKYMICCHIAHNNKILIILIRYFSKEQYVLPEDDMRYAIETCRRIVSVLV